MPSTTSTVLQDATFLDADGQEHPVLEHLLNTGSDSPDSRYGQHPEQWAPVAAAYFLILVRHHGERTHTLLDEAVNRTVNDDPAVGGVIVWEGPMADIDPADILPADVRHDYPF
ncbi:MAG: hypothetical protein JHD16_00270 [Solirubrobacteraceae bacterium]|nr:hypothetical protein [Solirubrobacteraceae bacterium]